MKVGIWYWHTPFQVTDKELGLLHQIGVSTIYARTCTFTTDGTHVKTMIPQRWSSNAGGLPVVLTFNFDAGLGSHFHELPNERMAAEIVPQIVRERFNALKHALNVKGIQMDVDCPTRLLPKYAELLNMIRSLLVKANAFKPGDTFSSTALQTWLNSQSYRLLADACDFVVPQFYEGRTGKTIDNVQPIADTGNLNRGMAQAESAGRPFFVGLGIYGHALLYNQAGRLVSMYHGLQPEDALRHPSLKMEQVKALQDGGKPIGENLLVLRAVKPDLNGNGLGYQIAYVLPTAEMLLQELKIVRESRPSDCQGIILYRFPEPADELSLPLVTIAQTFGGKSPSVAVESKISGKATPWDLIGSSRTAKRAPYEYTVVANSTGTAPTIAAWDALTVFVQFNGTGLDQAQAGEFDEAQTGTMTSENNFEPCAPAHANAVRLRRYHVLPGSKIRSGALAVPADGPVPVNVLSLPKATL